MPYTIFVFAKLKPSQINYKINPLSKSSNIKRVYILRKTPLHIDNEKISCLSLPKILRIPPFYWLFTALYGAFLIKKYKANLILNYNIFPHGFNAFVASKLTGLPYIFSEINEDTQIYSKRFLVKHLIKKIIQNAKIICVPGSKTENFWTEKGYMNTKHLHSTIDTNYFTPNHQIAKHYDFLYVGVFDNNKRPDVIIKAFHKIVKSGYDVNLCLIGFGNQINILEKLVLDLNLKNRVDIKKTNHVLEYYQKSKIFLMASLSEGLPCAMMEAMACELPVVIPPVGDISDVIVHKQNGFLHNNSINDLSAKMSDAYLNYDKLGELKVNARNTIVDNHSFETATQKWDEIFTTNNFNLLR